MPLLRHVSTCAVLIVSRAPFLRRRVDLVVVLRLPPYFFASTGVIAAVSVVLP